MLSKITIVALIAVVVVALATPPPPVSIVPILSQESDVQPDGTYKFAFESADGTKQEQSGSPKPVDKEIAEVVEGLASWTDPEGGKHDLVYQADENGYRPQSADLPVSPPIPEQIARALEWISAHPEPENQVQ